MTTHLSGEKMLVFTVGTGNIENPLKNCETPYA